MQPKKWFNPIQCTLIDLSLEATGKKDKSYKVVARSTQHSVDAVRTGTKLGLINAFTVNIEICKTY